MEGSKQGDSVILGELEKVTESGLHGEGPIWDAAEKRLIWVDVHASKLNVWNSVTKESTSYDVGAQIGSAAPIKDGRFVIAVATRLEIFNPKDGSKTLLHELGEKGKDTQFNDGKCDDKGNFWVGTMNLDLGTDVVPIGRFYKLGRDGKVSEHFDRVKCSNGIDWSLKDDVMYYIDSFTYEVSSFKFDAAKGEISDRKVAFKCEKDWGIPDGCAMDNEGKLWIAFYNGSAVRRFDPITGKLLEVVKVPVKNVTSVCFGGEDNQTIYITTSKLELSEEERKENPLAGCVFAAKTKVKGRTQKTDFEAEF